MCNVSRGLVLLVSCDQSVYSRNEGVDIFFHTFVRGHWIGGGSNIHLIHVGLLQRLKFFLWFQYGIAVASLLATHAR